MSRALFALLICSLPLPSADGDDRKAMREARLEGSTFALAKNYVEAERALDRALSLIPPDDLDARRDIYGLLISVYREQSKSDKLQMAVEFVLNTEASADVRDRAAGNYAAYLKKTGKEDWAITHYEEVLKTTPRDPPALAFLTNVYLGDRRDIERRKRGQQLQATLKEVNVELAAKGAERMEARTRGADKRVSAIEWMKVAALWAEAKDSKRALAAIEKSRQAPKDTKITRKMCHEGIGDVLVAIGEKQQALVEYQAALKLADSPNSQSFVERKIKSLQGSNK